MTERTYKAQSIGQSLKVFNPDHKEDKRVKEKYHNEHKASTYTTIGATYPYINRQAMKETIKRYKLYVSLYNDACKLANIGIKEYNNMVNNYYAENEVEPAYKNIAGNFKTSNRKLHPKEYNLKAEQINLKLGQAIILQKKHQRVNVQAEKVFVASLYQYNKTFKKVNKTNRKIKEKSFRGLPKLDFNSGQIKALKENGYNMVDFCTKTIRRHRQRLEEAQIYRDYTFHGQDKGIKLHINNQILVVFDDFEKKVTTIENQLVNSKERTLCTDNNILTIIKINENIKKIKGSSLTLSNNNFKTQEPTVASLEGKNLPAKKFELNLPKNSSDLKKYLINQKDFANQLANGYYFEAPQVQKGAFMYEAQYGSLTQLEFKRVLANHLFMRLSCIYDKKGITASYGSWNMAITEFDKKFLVNDNKTLKSKLAMAKVYTDTYFYCIDHIIRFHKENPKYNSPYPNVYFNFKFENKESRSFRYYSKKIWKEYLKAFSEDEILEKTRKDTELEYDNEYEFKTPAYNRLLKQVRLHLNGKKSIEQLIEYSRNNHTKEFYDRLEDIINEEKEKRNTKDLPVAS